jgi:hypothetical protein
MRYTVTTFKVRLEVCDIGDRTGGSDDVVRVARSIFAELDADKGADVIDALRAGQPSSSTSYLLTLLTRQL